MQTLATTPRAYSGRAFLSHSPLRTPLRTLVASLLLVLGAGLTSAAASAEELPQLPLTVNVNTADARTIANVLQGVGLSRAAAIVAYREANGAFKSIDALTAVKGVGDRTVELNATRIMLSE